jgi:hypothetical protein
MVEFLGGPAESDARAGLAAAVDGPGSGRMAAGDLSGVACNSRRPIQRAPCCTPLIESGPVAPKEPRVRRPGRPAGTDANLAVQVFDSWGVPGCDPGRCSCRVDRTPDVELDGDQPESDEGSGFLATMSRTMQVALIVAAAFIVIGLTWIATVLLDNPFVVLYASLFFTVLGGGFGC